jgi:tetraacyldisaccharide 4'-kinase
MKVQPLIERLETYLTDLIAERLDRRRDQVALGILFVLSRTYRTLVQWRLSLFKHRILRHHTLGCLVVSIGNLTVGGTGKTPVVEVFARSLTQRGRKVAILSRGYRSKDRPFWRKMRDLAQNRQHEIPPRVVSDGTGVLLDSEMAGDEPYMLAKNLRQVVVLVDKDRVKSGRYAIRQFGVDTLLLDDGFQYLALAPRLNILLVDATNPFDNHHLLPRGLLREPLTNVRRADVIFLTKSNGGAHLKHLKQFIRSKNAKAEIIECTHRPMHLENVITGERQPLSFLKDQRVASICGIAAPESFERFLHQFGANLVHFERYADHHRYTRDELADFMNGSREKGASMVLTTEKDAVRFPKLPDGHLPSYFMRVEIDILSGQESFDQCIARICFTNWRKGPTTPAPEGEDAGVAGVVTK